MLRYLEHDEVLVIHARILDKTGGMHGLRDTHLFASMMNRPQMAMGGKDLYPTLFDKAAAYFESCAFHHMFVDGNKRTAIALATRFLYLNDYDIQTSNKIIEVFVLEAVTKKLSLSVIAAWFRKHSKKMSRKSR